ncbi:MAG: VanZ family protein [Lachnospiraceae bacterium]|nr:VanZ family protein [Lachnospiraceae bacterium]MBR5765566.1 VanZ family protein [Lachnospiraceae bacterium]MBR6487005.1 VanZ family protein [Lachnospiraceae bacterium]
MLLRALNDIWTALRSFDEQALTFASRAVLIYVIYILTANIIKKVRGKKCLKLWQMVLSVFVFSTLCVYLSYLVSLTLSGREAGSRVNKVNLEIFGTFDMGGSMSAFALENVLLFIPFGLLVPLTARFFKKWWNLVLAAFISSMLIEISQLLTARGYFEIDDILLNTLGAFLGYMVFWIAYHSYIAVKHETQIPLSRHEQQLNRITLFLIQLLPIVLLVLMILGFGNDDALKSAELSSFVTEKLLYIVNKLLNLKWTAQKIEESVPVYEGAVRKGAHITEFALLTLFTFVFLYCRKLKGRTARIITFVFSFIIAVIDEFNQYRIDGRSGSLKDVALDCFGSAIILIVIFVLLKIAGHYHGHKHGKAGVPVQ